METTEVLIPKLTPMLTLKAVLAEPIEIGLTVEGQRRIIPILGGTFEGSYRNIALSGKVEPAGAADWQLIRPDSITQAEATYALRTDDNVLLQVSNFGLRHGPDEVLAKLFTGEEVDPTEYYFRSNPRIKAPEGKYAWLNGLILVASGARYKDSIKLWFFAVE
jgi:hypothetical protein